MENKIKKLIEFYGGGFKGRKAVAEALGISWRHLYLIEKDPDRASKSLKILIDYVYALNLDDGTSKRR